MLLKPGKIGIFQPAILVYRRVTPSARWAPTIVINGVIIQVIASINGLKYMHQWGETKTRSGVMGPYQLESLCNSGNPELDPP